VRRAVLVVLAACGRVRFDPLVATGDAPVPHDAPMPIDAPSVPPSFVQFNDGVATTSTTETVAFAQAVVPGDLIIVTVAYQMSPLGTLASLVDTNGETFTVLPQLIAEPDSASNVAYAFATASSTDAITATMSASGRVVVRIHELAGVDAMQPIDAHVTNLGSAAGSDAIAASITTANPDELVFAYALSSNGTASVGTGFTPLSTTSGDVTEVRAFAQPGTYPVTATSSGTPWSLEALALRP